MYPLVREFQCSIEVLGYVLRLIALELIAGHTSLAERTHQASIPIRQLTQREDFGSTVRGNHSCHQCQTLETAEELLLTGLWMFLAHQLQVGNAAPFTCGG